MRILPVTTWMARRILRTPVGLLWITLSVAAGPILALFTPVGLLGRGDLPDGRILQLAYLSALFGVLNSMVALENGRWLLERCDTGRRTRIRLLAMLTTALAGGCAVLAVAAIQRLHPDWLTVLPLFGVAALHLVLLAGWILEAPGSKRSRLILLPFVSWILPAIIQASSGPTGWMIAFFRSHPVSITHRDLSPIELLAGIGPILALASSHALFVRWKHIHEVRHSR